MPSKPIELPPDVAKAFVKHMRDFYAEPSAIRRDHIAGDAAFMLKSYLPVRDRKLRLCGTCSWVACPPPNIGEHRKGFDARHDVKELFAVMKDRA
jgi:hypothetical protein